MSLTTTFGRGGLGAGDEPVVILGLADDLEVVLAREHGLHAFADEDAVVGDEDRDRSHASIQYHSRRTLRGRRHRVCGGCQPHPSDAGQCPGAASVRAYGCPDEAMRPEEDISMRIERSITTVSWIPSDLLEGMGKMATRMKLAHHDPPPPDALGTDTSAAIEQLRLADRFRFANQLRAYIEVDDDGRITDCGYCGGGVIGATTIGHGVGSITIPAVKLPDRQSDPEVTADCGDVHADSRRTNRRPDAACGEARPVHPVPRADRVDHA